MSVRFYLDAEGYICGGICDDPSFSEKFDLAFLPIKTLEQCGVAIAWPDGIPFEHTHYCGNLDLPDDTERAA